MGKIQKGCKTACLWHIALAACMDIFCFTGSLSAQELRIGTASADISPELPVALSGQFELRIAKTAETPLTANVIALESTKNGCPADTAIMVACDLTGIPYELIHEVRDAVSLHIPRFDVRKIVLNATHTHTSPVVANDLDCWGYRIPDEGVTQAEAYRSFVVRQITGAIVRAWNSRSSGTVSWGLSDAVSREAARQMAADPKAADQVYSKMKWYGDVVRRFEKQKANPHATHTMELHVLRMGDIAVCATEWELFTDYGIRIQARSKAVQTFVIQLAGPDTYYLPTEKAVRGGSYSAIPASNLIGPEGGQILTDKVTELINSLW